jgi:hypothetical protein
MEAITWRVNYEFIKFKHQMLTLAKMHYTYK